MTKIPDKEIRENWSLPNLYEDENGNQKTKLKEQESISHYNFNPYGAKVNYDTGEINLAFDNNASSLFNDFIQANYIFSPRYQSPHSLVKDLFKNINSPIVKDENFEEIILKNKEKTWTSLGKVSYLDKNTYPNCLLLVEGTFSNVDNSLLNSSSVGFVEVSYHSNAE